MHLLDTNIILRYIIGDGGELFERSKQIFEQIHKSEIQVQIPVYIILELVFVLKKFYEVPLDVIVEKLEKILLLDSVINSEKYFIVEALHIHLEDKVDLPDALLLEYSLRENIPLFTFDKKLNKLVESHK